SFLTTQAGLDARRPGTSRSNFSGLEIKSSFGRGLDGLNSSVHWAKRASRGFDFKEPKFGIEPSRDRRDRILRNLAGEGSLCKQPPTALKTPRRYRAHPADRVTGGERGLLWQLHQMGWLDLSERQIRRILR